jgi:hypothetical protein
VAIKSRMTQDRRRISRIPVRIPCHFTQAGVRHEASVISISLTGAFLSAKHLPQTGGTITLSLTLPNSKNVLEIQCSVVRGGWGISDHGKLGRFGVRFSHTPPDLVVFVSKPK